ncbi:hypothetical protein [Nocardiopsis alborubida]|uniref:Uncharacterized protein n=1 Tax=Nocardiopsis alborubida TaxID=146802 RepID=A0A7X6MB74_9ACTN|nr:hypothetical protein [Nocardiopsis alborubida]NKY96555.1 hypothetical protein [Nocardiopsis alborubida]
MTIATVKSEDRTEQAADAGRRSVHASAHDDDCHELGHMLGLLRTNASGRIAEAIPEEFDLVDHRG